MLTAGGVIIGVCGNGAKAKVDVNEQAIFSGIVTSVTNVLGELEEAIKAASLPSLALIPATCYPVYKFWTTLSESHHAASVSKSANCSLVSVELSSTDSHSCLSLSTCG